MRASGARLSLGLLTVVPAGNPEVDRRRAGSAMVCAPAVGLGLGAVLGVAAAVAGALGLGAALAAVGVLAGLALLTRGLHLDGLADTADGLGSALPPRAALAVMRRSDTGPFGVVALVLVLLADAAALARLGAGGWGALAVVVPAAGRLVLPLACREGVPPAREDGLGALVAGSVRVGAAAASLAATLAALGAAGALLAGPAGGPTPAQGAVAALVATLAGVAASELLLVRCARRLGGVTGDVLGACVETAQCAALVTLAAAYGLMGPG